MTGIIKNYLQTNYAIVSYNNGRRKEVAGGQVPLDF